MAPSCPATPPCKVPGGSRCSPIRVGPPGSPSTPGPPAPWDTPQPRAVHPATRPVRGGSVGGRCELTRRSGREDVAAVLRVRNTAGREVGGRRSTAPGGNNGVGLTRIELVTSALSVLRSNQLSYSPANRTLTLHHPRTAADPVTRPEGRRLRTPPRSPRPPVPPPPPHRPRRGS